MDYDQFRHNSASSRVAAADYLLENRDKIKSRWQALALEKNSHSSESQFPVIVNSLGIFIEELASILKQAESDPEVLSEHAMSKIYGGQKAVIEGYSLSRLLWEFGLVRETVIRELQNGMKLTPETHRLIDKTIDVAMSLAATEFEKVQNKKLQATLAKVEASNRALDEFALIAAHDLNSPLATATGLLELLHESISSNANSEASEYVEILDRALTRMRGLVTSLLEYARLGKSNAFKKIDLNDSLSASLQNLAQLIEETNAKIIRDSLPEVKGDFNLISLVFQNLITNSIKYRGVEKPEIRISAQGSEAEWWVISVKDNGVGFESKDKEDIFNLYKRLKNKADQPGAGIGLATCRKIIELHGGKIWAESSLGSGSTFYFSLPKVFSTAAH